MNKILIIFFFLIYAMHSYGQISFGIKGGLNRNQIVIENAPFQPKALYHPNIGLHFGLFSHLRVYKVELRPELLFIQRGANSHIYLNGASQPATDSQINLNYLELPIMFSFYQIKSLSLETGPTLSYKISAKEISDNGKKDVSDRFNKSFDFGINLGVKINISPTISMVGRYYHGFRSVVQFPMISPNTFPSSSTNTIQAGLHYLLKH